MVPSVLRGQGTGGMGEWHWPPPSLEWAQRVKAGDRSRARMTYAIVLRVERMQEMINLILSICEAKGARQNGKRLIEND